MRQAIERQRRLDCGSVSQVVLNLNCRDELIPVLRGLQQVYATPKVRDAILKLVKRDVSAKSRSDRPRPSARGFCRTLDSEAGIHFRARIGYGPSRDLQTGPRFLIGRGFRRFWVGQKNWMTPTVFRRGRDLGGVVACRRCSKTARSA